MALRHDFAGLEATPAEARLEKWADMPKIDPPMRLLLSLWFGLLVLCLSDSATAAGANPRVALVIGNAAYREAPLANPVNDARAMAQTLRDAGFATTLLTDANQQQMVEALRQFGDRLKGASTGVFYFAGHGMQIKGRNHLVPVGAQIQREDEVPYMAIDAQAVLDKMESARNGNNLLILDACRNNPFARSFRSSAQGLAPMDAPVGTLVAFATAPGSVASDGTGSNGLYTAHLLREMRTPGAKIEDVFKRVRASVRKDSAGQQVPWEATSLEGDLVLFAPKAPVAAPIAQPAQPAEAKRPFRVGDTWRFRSIDHLASGKATEFSVRIAQLLPDGGWETSRGDRFDAEGRQQKLVLKDGWREWSPHTIRWWPGMRDGEVRNFRIEGVTRRSSEEPSRNVLDYEARVT
ncbi:MAG: hypothetical protein RL227_616, partial [Pseudomonadota bacterium]